MARETKTIQCYPDDDKINERVKRYEAFGWELISNQHCQEYDGQTSSRDYIDGSTTITKHYSSFNKLTFSREKTSPWYGEVTKLEKQYEDIMDRRPRDYSIEPSKGWVIYGGLGVVIGICLLLLLLSWRFSPAVCEYRRRCHGDRRFAFGRLFRKKKELQHKSWWLFDTAPTMGKNFCGGSGKDFSKIRTNN